jgi:polyisoprenoid-binding protein YceI
MKTKQCAFREAILFLVVLSLIGTTAATAAQNYAIDPVHTSVTFKIKHLGISNVHGRFNDVSGTLIYDSDSASNSSIEMQVKTASIDTINSKRDDDLRSPNFFDARKFPFIQFKSTSVKKITEDTFEVAGNLTVHGVTRPITVSVLKTGSGKDPWGGYRIGFETVFNIKRSDFGMQNMLGIVGDKVQLAISLEAVGK